MSETRASGLGIRQQSHFEKLHTLYERHQYHPAAMEYRRRFIYAPMFAGIDLNGARAIELCSGSGHNSLSLKQAFPGVSVTGLDISRAACADYERLVGVPCQLLDLTEPGGKISDTFDIAFVIGGLPSLHRQSRSGPRQRRGHAETGRPLPHDGAEQSVLSRPGEETVVPARPQDVRRADRTRAQS